MQVGNQGLLKIVYQAYNQQNKMYYPCVRFKKTEQYVTTSVHYIFDFV